MTRAPTRRRAAIAAVTVAASSALAVAAAAAPGDDGDDEGGAPRPAARAFTARWSDETPLPEAVANNAVAALELDGKPILLSFLGLGAAKDHAAITRAAYRYDIAAKRWSRIADVPGPAGRLAATAQAVAGKVYLIGGYTVAPDGKEVSVPDVDVYDPAADAWSKGAPIPVPSDDAVSGLWRGQSIYLISGWSDRDNVAAVQIYDPAADAWRQATPIPGEKVFGHAGGIVGDAIVYVDGVIVDRARRPGFFTDAASWIGRIDADDPAKIAWAKLPDHPGGARYRIAAGPLDDSGILAFKGGTDRAYNYDGVGYDGTPADASATTFFWDAERDAWGTLPPDARASMDHRGLVAADGALFLVGGLDAKRRPTNRVARLTITETDEGEGGR